MLPTLGRRRQEPRIWLTFYLCIVWGDTCIYPAEEQHQLSSDSMLWSGIGISIAFLVPSHLLLQCESICICFAGPSMYARSIPVEESCYCLTVSSARLSTSCSGISCPHLLNTLPCSRHIGSSLNSRSRHLALPMLGVAP